MFKVVCKQCLYTFETTNEKENLCENCKNINKSIEEYVGNGYYVYELIRLDTNEPFYVGKGKNDRAFRKIPNKKDKRLSVVVEKLRENGYDYAVNIIINNIDNENEAYEIERNYIESYVYDFGYKLKNIIFAGDEEDSAKRRKISEELWKDQEYIEKRAESFEKEEVKQKCSLAAKNAWEDEEYRNKVTKALKRPRKKKIAKVINNETNETIYEVEGISNLQTYMSNEMGIGDKKWRRLKKGEIVENLRIEIV